MACKHQTMADHSELLGSVRVWRCSGCGKEARWCDSWGYFGNIECLRCQTPQMDFVYCSEACRAVLADKPTPRVPSERTVSEMVGQAMGTRQPRRAAWERKALAAGWNPPTLENEHE